MYKGMFSSTECDSFFSSKQIFQSSKFINHLSQLMRLKFKLDDIYSIMQLSHKIMKHFISNDNNIIIISLHKLVLIYIRQLRIKKMHALYKWHIKSHKIKTIQLKLNDIEFKQQHLYQSNSAQNIESFKYRLNGRNYKQNTLSNNNEEMMSISKQEHFEIISTFSNKKTLRSKRDKRNRSSNFSSSFISHIPVHLEERFKLKESMKTHIDPIKLPPTHKQKHKQKVSKFERDKILTNLSQGSSAHKEKKIEQIRQEQEEIFNCKCPFKPTLYSKYSQSQTNLTTNNNNHSSISTISFIERLQQYEINKKNNLSNIKKDIEINIPKPPSAKKNNFEIPIQKNYFQLKKQKVDSIQRVMESEQGITFHPHLNDNKNKNVKDNITKRNKNFLINKEKRLLNGTYGKNNSIDKECTFEPIISTNMKRHYKNKFDKRMEEYKSIYETNKDHLRLKYENSYSFMPKISKNTEMILNNKRIMQERVKKKYAECNKKNNSFNCGGKDTDTYNKLISGSGIYRNVVNIKSNDKKNHNVCVKGEDVKGCVSEDMNSIINYESKEKGGDKKQDVKTVNGNKLKLMSESLTDDKAFQMAKMKLSVDDSLEKFQLKYSELTKKKDGAGKNKIPINVKEHECSKKFINKMNYYDNLD